MLLCSCGFNGVQQTVTPLSMCIFLPVLVFLWIYDGILEYRLLCCFLTSDCQYSQTNPYLCLGIESFLNEEDAFNCNSSACRSLISVVLALPCFCAPLLIHSLQSPAGNEHPFLDTRKSSALETVCDIVQKHYPELLMQLGICGSTSYEFTADVIVIFD